MRHLGLIGAFAIALVPCPAQAQGDFIKDKLRALIEKSGVYVSTSTRSSLDNEVRMGPAFGVGYGTAGSKRTGVKYPISFSGYGGNLETTSGTEFGRFRAKQILSGIGYQWVRGRMVYGAQLNVGYSFNNVTVNDSAAAVFNSPLPITVTVSNSFVVRPLIKAEYFFHRKLSLRSQVSYTYTDPDVVVQAAGQRFTREWHPHHVHFSLAIGVFPFRK